MDLETQLSQQPSAFTISVVFGGTIGLVAANLLGYDGGAGFFIGAGLVFLILAILIIQARQGETIEIRLDALADLIVADLAEKDWELEQRSTSEDSPSHPLFSRVLGISGEPLSGRELEELNSHMKGSLDTEIEALAREKQWSDFVERMAYMSEQRTVKPFTHRRFQESGVFYRRVLRRLMVQGYIRRR